MTAAMGAMSYEGDIARIQRSLTQSHDVTARRTALLQALNLRAGEQALELGCGGGFWAAEAARFVGPAGRLVAIDVSEDQIAAARSRCAEFDWVECRVANATDLPFEDGSFDAVFGNQIIEYIADLDAALAEVRRVLHPGGRFVVMATNWSSMVWHSKVPERMERVLRAWATHAPYHDLPAILPARLRQAGLQPLRQVSVPTLNGSYHQHSFGYWIARLIHAFVVGQGAVSEAEADAWLGEFDELESAGAYFLSVTPVLTEAIKIA
jgi:ubiquinone/menaquinone biosynthesis C-methylase UbiE